MNKIDRIRQELPGFECGAILITSPVNNGIIVIASRLLNENTMDLMKTLNAGTLPASLKVVEREFVVR